MPLSTFFFHYILELFWESDIFCFFILSQPQSETGESSLGAQTHRTAKSVPGGRKGYSFRLGEDWVVRLYIVIRKTGLWTIMSHVLTIFKNRRVGVFSLPNSPYFFNVSQKSLKRLTIIHHICIHTICQSIKMKDIYLILTEVQYMISILITIT